MPVKYWSFAGLMLTQWCNASCASCYLACGPVRADEMTVAEALRLWRQLVDASPHGCRIHLTGGEPFGRWELLREVVRRAAEESLPPADLVETNAFWAVDDRIIQERLAELDAAGVGMLAISTDPYHQQFVPIERVRRLADGAKAAWGADRVRVRWEDWLETGSDTAALTDSQRAELFLQYARDGRDRMNGRAAMTLADQMAREPAEAFRDWPCRGVLLRGKHVHISAGGWITPGTCAGIVVGRADEQTSVADCWRRLEADHAERPIVGVLAAAGPVGLLEMAAEAGYRRAEGYAGKCHLCWSIRRHLRRQGSFGDELWPAAVYEDSTISFSSGAACS